MQQFNEKAVHLFLEKVMIVPQTVTLSLQRAKVVRAGLDKLVTAHPAAWSNDQKLVLKLLLEITTQLTEAITQLVDANNDNK